MHGAILSFLVIALIFAVIVGYIIIQNTRLLKYVGVDMVEWISRDISEGEIIRSIISKLKEKRRLLDYQALYIIRQLSHEGMLEESFYENLSDIIKHGTISPTALNYSCLCSRWKHHSGENTTIFPWVGHLVLAEKICSPEVFQKIKDYEKGVRECARWWKWWGFI